MEYEISCKNASAKVNTTGGELVSFSVDGISYLWVGDAAFWSGHAPVLFPTVGSLKNRETEIEGIRYPMKKHGFARKVEFALLEKTENSALFSLKADAETKKSYPYEFELREKHTVTKNGFKTELEVYNTDSKEILFGIGGHTGFNCPLFEGTQFEDYAVQFDKQEDGPFYYTRTEDCDGVIHREDRVPKLEGTKEIALQYSLFDRDVLVIDNLKSEKIRLVNKKDGRGIAFAMKGFSSMGLWTPPLKKAPFICLEPWTVNPDFSDNSGIFAEKPNINRLAPGKKFAVSYEVTVL